MSGTSQLYLLVDHIKLLLLESQRATKLNQDRGAQDGHISRSLDQMRDGIDALEQQHRVSQASQEDPSSSDLQETIQDLRHIFTELTNQYSRVHVRRSLPLTSISQPAASTPFRDNPLAKGAVSPFGNDSRQLLSQDDQNRTDLFAAYHDNSEEQDQLSQENRHADENNQQVHAYHASVLRDQDEQLDRLGESIGRQRDLSIQIGDELDDQIQLLDDVETHIDRHQTRLDGARRQVENVAKRARDNKQITTILILVIILIILIIVLK